MERSNSMVVGNDIGFKGVNFSQDILIMKINHIKTTNLSTYTHTENCYTPLTGSRPKSPRQSVNKHSNWVKLKGGNQGEVLSYLNKQVLSTYHIAFI